MGKITSKCKGGVIVEHLETGSLMFCPGSQISDKPLKDISHLMNEPQKFALIKLDKIRGNACVSRRQIISFNKKEDKAKIIEKYKVGDVIKNAVVKGYSSFGCFFDVNSELMFLFIYKKFHIQELIILMKFLILEKNMIYWSFLLIKKNYKLAVVLKQLSPDPFEHISNYELNKKYKVKLLS